MRVSCFLIFLCLCVSNINAYYLGMLGDEPQWENLEVYQETYTREAFVEALEKVYLPYGYDDNWIQIYPGFVDIRTNRHDPKGVFRLRFKGIPLFFEHEPFEEEPASKETNVDQPLTGLVIAIDPGHIGGDYSRMERRHFSIGGGDSVKEGDNSLIVASILQDQLQSLGAEVTLLRNTNEPVTLKRPDGLWLDAEAIEQQAWLDVNRSKNVESPWDEAWFKSKIDKRAEMLFYRVSEIQARAKLINKINPDFTIAIHFNVSPWPDGSTEGNRQSAKSNHLHVLVNGTYTGLELGLDDVRYHLFQKLLSRNHEIEIPLANAVAEGLAATTELPPFIYKGKNASSQSDSGYVWARNLLANRIFKGSVIYTEAYAANSEDAYLRLKEGNYEGFRLVAGRERVSIFREYADGITKGILSYYSEK